MIDAENGWPLVSMEGAAARLKALGSNLSHVRLQGSHHLHLDPETR